MGLSVVLAEGNLILRTGLSEVLSLAGDGIDVVAQCDGMDALLAAVEHERPDVVVTAARIPPTFTDEGIRVARTLPGRRPPIGVVVLSASADPAPAVALAADGLGRRAYLVMEQLSDPGQLVTAIRSVAGGGSVVDARVVEPLVREQSRTAGSSLSTLSPRELDVLREIAQGKSNGAIAETLVLTKRAVEKHIGAIFLKLDLAFADDVSKRVKATLLFLADADRRDADGPPPAP